MTLQCVAVDLLNGNVLADLPGFEPQWPLRRTISAADTTQGVLHLTDATSGEWERALLEGGSLLAFFDDADPVRSIVWAGYVVAGTYDASTDDVSVDLATFEAVLDRVFVGDVTYLSTQHRDDIAADLVANWFTPSCGIPLNLAYTPGNGPTPPVMANPPVPNASMVFQNTDNASVKARLDQVFGQLGGEYTVQWGWANGGETLVPTLVFGDQVGTSQVDGFDPVVSFSLPGSLINLKQNRSYSPDKGARKIQAYSSGQGSSTPFATPVYGPDDGRPLFEFRWQPAPSISPALLQTYAQQAVGIIAPGARTVSLVASTTRTDGRRVGVDWGLGDDIGYSAPASFTNEEGRTVKLRSFPNGVSGVGRCIAYEIDATTVTPILADTTVYVQAT